MKEMILAIMMAALMLVGSMLVGCGTNEAPVATLSSPQPKVLEETILVENILEENIEYENVTTWDNVPTQSW